MRAGPLPADGRRPGGQQFVPRPATWEPGPDAPFGSSCRTRARRAARSGQPPQPSVRAGVPRRPPLGRARRRSRRATGVSRCCSPGGRWTCAPIAVRSAFPAGGSIRVRRRPTPRCARRTRRSGSIRRWSRRGRARAPQHGREPQLHRARRRQPSRRRSQLQPASPEVDRVLWVPLAEFTGPTPTGPSGGARRRPIGCCTSSSSTTRRSGAPPRRCIIQLLRDR